MRSVATNLPFFAGAAGLLAFGAYLFGWQIEESEDERNKSQFKRRIASSDLSAEQLLFFTQCEDPIREALRRVADPATSETDRLALRAALAVSL